MSFISDIIGVDMCIDLEKRLHQEREQCGMLLKTALPPDTASQGAYAPPHVIYEVLHSLSTTKSVEWVVSPPHRRRSVTTTYCGCCFQGRTQDVTVPEVTTIRSMRMIANPYVTGGTREALKPICEQLQPVADLQQRQITGTARTPKQTAFCNSYGLGSPVPFHCATRKQ